MPLELSSVASTYMSSLSGATRLVIKAFLQHSVKLNTQSEQLARLTVPVQIHSSEPGSEPPLHVLLGLPMHRLVSSVHDPTGLSVKLLLPHEEVPFIVMLEGGEMPAQSLQKAIVNSQEFPPRQVQQKSIPIEWEAEAYLLVKVAAKVINATNNIKGTLNMWEV